MTRYILKCMNESFQVYGVYYCANPDSAIKLANQMRVQNYAVCKIREAAKSWFVEDLITLKRKEKL